ncbi:hypothetical protein E3Z27_04860 [Pseudomonas mediterranea]|jgi:hypothetical protein|uniref:DUF3077 domain-containing protein n=1 Tax=Pseudomonas mediterranea TaxID=183795 RepID=A0AAX2DJ40_9PSED|nr:hypothetical protein [Pseudomonas mediterranea]KGU84987.1 hypothetical protein N005_16695 [Pseudomonas mediterranea CFBP 5447]QHA81058.1 hypothetical protein E3Z27_04860 [Pseudomonas mediterranea]UZE01962.1 hypothetical protein LOY71_04840 [Pseudomonas mediterranea]CAH0264100.1 hypothetical protein SRABI112_03451 [Pseudomonas mediterranea]SDU75436.1 hypothetical protein SAMN05216476_5437 [Pseudomonas mediterranea]
MELLLETVALYSLKLAYETEGHSPILRDDPLMGSCDREVFGLLVRRGEVAGIQSEIGRCLDLALAAVGGMDTVLGCELHRLAKNFGAAQMMEGLYAPAIILRDYLRDVL